MRSKRPRIVLTMIVKNEAPVIARCLESVKPWIDAWCIADTGSTDGTQDLVKELLKDIPGQLIERPWVDFASNRNEAIEGAQRYRPDYLLTLDADEKLETLPGFSLSGLCADTYSAWFRMHGSERKWPRKFLFRPHIRYRYVLDEVLGDGEENELLPACEVVSHTDGARSSGGMREKYTRDCEVLAAALEKEPNETRYWFYLGQRLMGAGRFAESIAAFEKRLELGGGFEQELAMSLLLIAQCKEELGAPFVDCQQAYLKAWQANPTRAEPLYALAVMHSFAGEHALAELYARVAQRLPRPAEMLLVDESVYAWRAADLLAGALASQGKLTEAVDILEKLLALPQTPKSEHERIAENIALIREQLTPAETGEKFGPDERTYMAQAARVRAGGFKAFRQLSIEFLQSFVAQAHPSPIRWLWLVAVALLGRAATIIPALLLPFLVLWAVIPIVGVVPEIAALAAASPLLWLTARRRFQDPACAALTVAAIGFALRGDSLATGVTFAALLACKEAGVLVLPAIALAWGFSGAPWLTFGYAAGGALAGYGASLALIFGSLALPVLKAGAKGHQTPYTKDYQSGAPHRLLIDLVLVSPLSALLALASGQIWILAMVLAIVAVHTLAPVRNVRLVLAAELLLRGAAAVTFGLWALPIVLVDAYVMHRLRQVYDPVTAALTSQLGMSK